MRRQPRDPEGHREQPAAARRAGRVRPGL